ncbi:MAG: DUF3592 domain-containing protein [Sarcina sp.]
MAISKKPQSKLSSFMGILILILFIGLLVYAFVIPFISGTVTGIDRTYTYFTGTKSEATIVGYKTISHTQKGGNITYTYIPELVLNIDGKEMLTTSDFNEVSSILEAPGTKVPVKFNPNNPLKCVITKSDFVNNASFIYVFIIIYIGFFIGSKLMEKKFRKYENSTETKGLFKILVITLILSLSLILFLVWQTLTGQLLGNIGAAIMGIIFLVLDLGLLKDVTSRYIKNRSYKYDI